MVLRVARRFSRAMLLPAVLLVLFGGASSAFAADPGVPDQLRVNALDLGTATGEPSSVGTPAVAPGNLLTPRFAAVVFSAVHVSGAAVDRAIVQVDDDNNWTNDPAPVDYFWHTDSAAPVHLADCDVDERCADIVYAGRPLRYNTVYYWRIKFVHKTTGEESPSWAVGAFKVASDLSIDSTVSHDPGGKSIRIAGPNAFTARIAVVDAQATTVTVWARYNAAYGAGAKPTLTLAGMGITPVVKSMDADQAEGANGADTWQRFTFAVTPSNGGDPGFFTLTINASGGATAANTWVDDIAVSQ
ncbi:MAG: hypothetical protein HY719_05440 [Planctomycetes bacterium]|nr:hypothetical protein [Planctomycetota bacterium]